MWNVFFIDQNFIFLSYFIPFNVVWMSEDKEIFSIVLKTDMIDPNSHVWQNVINWLYNLSKRINFFERATVRKIINFKLLHWGIRKLFETAANNLNRSIDDTQSNNVTAGMKIDWYDWIGCNFIFDRSSPSFNFWAVVADNKRCGQGSNGKLFTAESPFASHGWQSDIDIDKHFVPFVVVFPPNKDASVVAYG